MGLPTRKSTYHEGASVETDTSSFDRCHSSSNTDVLSNPIICIDRIEPCISSGFAENSRASKFRILSLHLTPKEYNYKEKAESKTEPRNEHSFQNRMLAPMLNEGRTSPLSLAPSEAPSGA